MRCIIFGIIAFFYSSFLFGQANHKIDLKTSNITIKGTSSLHDWESEATDFQGSGLFTIEGNQITNAEDILIKVMVKSIESGKSIMDGKTMDALKESKYPVIKFSSTETSIKDNQIICKGKMEMAGASKMITANVGYKVVQGVPEFTGSMKIVMSEYGIEPPVAMFGTLKTGDEVTIDFELKFVSNK
ncbi:YceI family protein [Reichenbachiella sp. MALMAid0571]|uniref:YceI family protein n=1 Tax=Reichenbachiella sp. MALMAid0571 TaxID=3143939 RepID=UPI0032DF1506